MLEHTIKKIIAVGIGKRKTSVAKVFFFQGSGNISINKKSFEEFSVGKAEQENIILKPLIFLNLLKTLDIELIVKGGGIFSQIDAIKLAICNALVILDNNYKSQLKKELLLKNDSRIKERRKYGLKKARKAPQYSKR